MAENDVARLIAEIEALRAELRAAISSGGGVPGGPGNNQLGQGNQGGATQAAANAMGLHQMTAQGYVSALTGSSSGSMSSLNSIANRAINSATPALKNAEDLGRTVEQAKRELRKGLMRQQWGNNTPPISFKPDIIDTLSDPEKSPWSAGSRGKTGYVNIDNLMRKLPPKTNFTQSMRNDVISMGDMIGSGKVSLPRLPGAFDYVKNKMFRKMAGKGFWFGITTDLVNGGAGGGYHMGDVPRHQYLTNAEERAGVTFEEKFGKASPTTGEQIRSSIGSAAATGGRWLAMGMVADAWSDRGTFSKSRNLFKRAAWDIKGIGGPMPRPGMATFKAIRGVGSGVTALAGSLGPAVTILAGINLLEEVFSPNSGLNTWSKKNEESDKKLRDQMNELASTDRWTTEINIRNALGKRGMDRSTWGVAWRGGLSILGVESPAEREERLRKELSDDFAQASKLADESAKEARLGNIKEAEKSIKKARQMAGDLVPVDWQDPMRIYTQQETASRSKACFARYLNNRVTNRAGD